METEHWARSLQYHRQHPCYCWLILICEYKCIPLHWALSLAQGPSDETSFSLTLLAQGQTLSRLQPMGVSWVILIMKLALLWDFISPSQAPVAEIPAHAGLKLDTWKWRKLRSKQDQWPRLGFPKMAQPGYFLNSQQCLFHTKAIFVSLVESPFSLSAPWFLSDPMPLAGWCSSFSSSPLSALILCAHWGSALDTQSLWTQNKERKKTSFREALRQVGAGGGPCPKQENKFLIRKL